MDVMKNSSKYVRILRKVVYSLLIVVVLISLVMLSLFVFAIFRKYLSITEMEEEIPSTFSYQYFELNPSTNDVNVGFTTLFQEIPEDGFYNYENSVGNLVMVSNFLTTQYQGIGQCMCTDTMSLLLDVPFLIATNNPEEASVLSEEELQRVCEVKLEGECEKPFSIESDVWEWDRFPKVVEEEEDMRHFMCEGHCVSDLSETKDIQLGPRKEIIDSFDCSKLWKSGEVYVPKRLGEEFEARRFWEFIHDEFVFNYLLEWCKESSPIFPPINYTNIDLQDEWSQSHGCYSERFENPTVKCVEIFDQESE